MRFKRRADAIKTLSLKDHRLFDEIVRVSPAVCGPNLSCSGKRVQLSITDLNDDCLVEIFRLLDEGDLWNVVDTCRRFRVAGKMAYPLIHQASNMMVDDDWEEESVKFINANLRRFGSEVSKLEISGTYGSTTDLTFHLDHCGEKLRSLRLENLLFNKDTALKIKTISENLESLMLKDCNIDDSEETSFLFDCRKLMNFEFESSSNIEILKKVNFENLQLKCLMLNLCFHVPDIINDPILEHILREQLKLQRLTVGGFGESSAPPENNILKIIIENRYEDLKALNLGDFKFDKGMIPGVRSLFSHLESLELDSCGLDILNADNVFTECKQLKKLKVSAIYNLMTTATDFPRLESLEMTNFDHFDKDSKPFDKFLMIHLNKLKELKLHLNLCNTKSIFEFIVSKDNSKNLKKLTVHYCNNFHICIPLSKFDNIKTIKLSCGIHYSRVKSSDMVLLLQNLASCETLNHLELTNVVSDNNIILKISKLKKLRHLELYNLGVFDSSLTLNVNFLCVMRQLCVLKIVGKWSIVDGDPLKLVTNLKKLTALSLNLKGFELDCETYNRMIELAHAQQRSITILTREKDKYYHDRILYIERDV